MTIEENNETEIENSKMLSIEFITEKLKNRRYISAEEEEEYMQIVYDSVVGDIENFMFLTPNWISREKRMEEGM